MAEPVEEPHEFSRLWQAFMTARLTLGLVLMLLQGALYATGTSQDQLLVFISAAYFAGTLATRVLAKPKPLQGKFNREWGVLVGLDVLAFSALQFLQGNSINYTPMFALPILLTSILGSLRLALGTAAGVTVLLLGGSLWSFLRSTSDVTPYFAQSALSGVGYFVIAFLANQLSTRLASEGQRARLNQLAANIHREVNELVIESLPDGVLIVDDRGCVRAANPAARQLLGTPAATQSPVFDLTDEAGWLPLLQLTRLSSATGQDREEEVTIGHPGRGPSRVRARTRLAAPRGPGGESLCVLFLQDQRELEARMRMDKLASMGRMSTAVAHEIRNPLAAIMQANALLEEDVDSPHLKKLTLLVGQNAKRLGKIVDDILDVSRAQPNQATASAMEVNLGEAIHQICGDWATQNTFQEQLLVELPDIALPVRFDFEHLRRVMVNLLDNAMRYASQGQASIQVVCSITADAPDIAVWSDGAPMDQSVQRHLFEPFFSSESRSSGLGLFISRELCSQHGASLAYQRCERQVNTRNVPGNAFVISFANSPYGTAVFAHATTSLPWQATLH